VRADLVDAVLARLGVERPEPDLAGLRRLYDGWCRSVPFDNTRKLIHIYEDLPGPLPGSNAEDFFDAWLAHGTGGTCWAGNGALHDLLEALGFVVARALATMLLRSDAPSPNHGTVIVSIEGARWIADASILSVEPIAIPERDTPPVEGPLPRFEWLGDSPAVRWRMLRAPDGFLCRIDRIGADEEAWNALHRRTTMWSPFNYMLTARLVQGTTSVGVEAGQRYVLDAGFDAAPVEGSERARFLVEQIGIAEEVAARVPPDRPIPPRQEARDSLVDRLARP